MENQAGPSKQYILNIFPEEEVTYQLNLNYLDHKKALKDQKFVQKLLNHAKSLQLEDNTKGNYDIEQNLLPSSSTEHSYCATTTLSSPLSESTNEPFFQTTSNEIYDNHHVTKNLSESRKETSKENVHWLFNAVNLLIDEMENLIDDLNHPVKRKNVFVHLSNILCSNGFEYTEIQCKNKWISLNKSYKSCKDIKKSTGRSRSRFHFYDKMEGILGKKPSISCVHTLNSLGVDVPNSVNITTDESGPENPEINTELGTSDSEDTINIETPRKRKVNMKEKFLNFKKNQEAEKKRRHLEICAIEKQKILIEEKKVRILKEILEKLEN